ncbi:MAG: DUF4286 family protein [Saprospiraceae bacterium]|nr:DUF4286 family protein [Saprospiraceae bacterium]
MIIYNVTVKVEPEVQEDWLQWMKNIHIPDVMDTGYFLKYKLTRVISMDEADGVTYSIQYTCQDMATLHQYQINHSARLQAEHNARYLHKFVAFRTLLEVLAE